MILRERASPDISEFLRYLATEEAENGLPTLNELSQELGVSVASLREQLEVARALGLIEIKPGRGGTRRRAYSFTPAVRQSLGYALALDDARSAASRLSKRCGDFDTANGTRESNQRANSSHAAAACQRRRCSLRT